MGVEFSQEQQERIAEVVDRYPTKQAAILPVLYMAQDAFGHLGDDVLEYVAGLMEIPAARLRGIVSFYTMFQTRPIGRYHIQVCRTLSCALAGAEHITAFLERKLAIQKGQTTADGKFTLTEVECLASCGTAPMMQINDDYYENLSQEKVEQILADLP